VDAKEKFASFIWDGYLSTAYGVDSCKTYENSSYTLKERVTDLFLKLQLNEKI
jgi:hypothetical protein